MNILSISAIVLTILLSSYTTAESLEVANITVYVIGQCINSLRLQQMQYNELNKVYSDFDAKTILIVLFLGVIVIYKILPPNKKEKYKPYFRWLVEKFEFLLDPKSAIKKFKRSLDKQKGDIAKDETVVNHPSKVPEDGLCSKCFGKGKVKCDCLNVRVTGHSIADLRKSNEGHYVLEITDVSISNQSIKREISIELSVELKHNRKLPPDKQISVKKRIDGITVSMGAINIKKEQLSEFKIDLGDCTLIEDIFGKGLSITDFNINVKVVNLNPIPNCRECNGVGYTPCSTCSQSLNAEIEKKKSGNDNFVDVKISGGDSLTNRGPDIVVRVYLDLSNRDTKFAHQLKEFQLLHDGGEILKGYKYTTKDSNVSLNLKTNPIKITPGDKERVIITCVSPAIEDNEKRKKYVQEIKKLISSEKSEYFKMNFKMD